MLELKCNRCKKDSGRIAYVMTTELIHNPTPQHIFDGGDIRITDTHHRIKYMLCQDCYIKTGLPNIYKAVEEEEVTFREAPTVPGNNEWHDLRKNPEDLPEDYSLCIVARQIEAEEPLELYEGSYKYEIVCGDDCRKADIVKWQYVDCKGAEEDDNN